MENENLNGTEREVGSKRKRPWNLSRKKQQQVMQTIVLYIGFFALGLAFSVVGPTLLDLERITNTDTQSASYVFTSRAICGLAGAIIAGVLIPRVHHWLFLAASCFIMGIVMAVVPYIRLLPLMCAFFAVSGSAGAFYDAGGNMVLLKVWGKENGPWMQALHCIFGFGALMGPLIAAPFLQSPNTQTQTNAMSISTVSPILNLNSSVAYPGLNGALKISENTSFDVDLNSKVSYDVLNNQVDVQNQTSNSTGSEAMPYETRITWAYFIVGVMNIFAGCLFITVTFCCSEIKLSCRKVLREEPEDKKKDENDQNRSRILTITLIGILFVFYLTYCILEMNVGNYLTAYSVKELGWSEKDGAQVTSAYWALFTAGRALGIIFIKYVSPTKIILGDVTISILSLGTLMFLAHAHRLVLWFCAMVLGLGISTIFATGITWAEIYINVSGGVGAIFMIAGAGGEMVGPIVIGILFERIGSQVFVYVMFSAACFLMVLFCIMLFIARKLGKRIVDRSPEKKSEKEELHPNEHKNGEPNESERI